VGMHRLGEVFQQVPDPWWLIDLNTSQFLDANQASVEQLGFSLDEVLRIGVIDVNRAIPSADSWRSITAGIPFGKTVRFLSELRCKSGGFVPVEVTFSRVKIGDGEALLAFTRDLSKIVALEDQLKEQQRLLRKLSEHVPGVLYQLQQLHDGALVLSYASDAARHVFGIELSAEGGLSDMSAILQLMPDEDRAAFRDDLASSARTLTPMLRESRIVRRGCVEWIETRATPERTDDGATQWHGFMTVISERKRAELDLRRRKDLWEMAANAAGFGIVQFADGGTTLSLDDRASVIHGMLPVVRELPVGEWLCSVHPDDRGGIANGLLKNLAEQALHARYRVEPRPGVEAVLELHARRFVHASGHSVEVVGTCRDVTEQVNAERLRREKEAAERASRAKSEFLSRVSHELRTPLNAILGFAQLMSIDRESPLTERQGKRLATLETAARRLLSLINDMLDLARIEREDFTLDCQPLDAMAAVRSSVEQIQPLAGRQPVLIEGDADAWVVGNTRALEQVLTNLLSNAVKYNRRDGHVRVVVRRTALRVCIDVSDEGDGMTPDQVCRLFQPFERLGAEKGSVPGTGLGLVIARELVVAMGGEVRVSSTPREGSTFTVVMSAADPPVRCIGDAQALEPLRKPGFGMESRRKVLYVEDEAVNVLLMQEVFRLCPNWTLEVAVDGAEGLRRVADERPDLVLVDMHLPDMNGLEFIDCLRGAEATRHHPCIALSADALCEQVDAARRAGFDDYWTKPIDVHRLLEDLSRKLCQPAAK
jgi:PAS domain S-box-containing protein